MVMANKPRLSQVFPLVNGAELVRIDQSNWSSTLRTLDGFEKYNPASRVQAVYRVDIHESIEGATLFDRLMLISNVVAPKKEIIGKDDYGFNIYKELEEDMLYSRMEEFYQFVREDYPDDPFHANEFVEMFAGSFLSCNGMDGDIYPFDKDSLIIEGNSIFENPQEIKIATVFIDEDDEIFEEWEDLNYYVPFICKGEECCYMVVMAYQNEDVCFID